MNINEELKLMFLHVPKAAGRSILEAFNLKKAGGQINRSIVDAVTTAQYFTSEELQQYIKFAVVRNPWDRMVSLYNFRKVNNDLYNAYKGANVFGGDQQTPEGTQLSFKEWVMDDRTRGMGHYFVHDVFRNIPVDPITKVPVSLQTENAEYIIGRPDSKELQEAIYKDFHQYYIMFMEWFPQYDFITLWKNKVFINEIFKVETLDQDVFNFCEKYNLPKVTLQRKNSVARSKKNYVDYYDDELRKFVEELFHKDIEVFEYKFGE